MIHGLLPLSLSLLASGHPPVTPPPAAPKPPAAIEATAPAPRELSVDIQRDWIRGALAKELGRKSLLDDFQVVTSKFSHGRVVLTDFQIAPGPRPGSARLTAFGNLRFKRRQLGMKWRGFKTHKKWFEKGEKKVATVRVSAVVSLGLLPAHGGVQVRLQGLRAKVTGHLRPARGVVARFDLKDRTYDWTPKDRSWVQGILTYAFELQDARISGVTGEAIRVTLLGSTPTPPRAPSADLSAGSSDGSSDGPSAR